MLIDRMTKTLLKSLMDKHNNKKISMEKHGFSLASVHLEILITIYFFFTLYKSVMISQQKDT